MGTVQIVCNLDEVLKWCVFHKRIIIIIIIIIITFMQGVYNYIPETNRISRVHSRAAIL
jgi:hypothetical protein